MKNIQRFITLKDADGILRPLAYIEKLDRHLHMQGLSNKFMKYRLAEGETFVEVEMREVESENKA